MKVLVNKGTLLSEVSPLLLLVYVGQTSRECGWRERCIICGYKYGIVEKRVWCKKVKVYVKAVCVGFKFANKMV